MTSGIAPYPDYESLRHALRKSAQAVSADVETLGHSHQGRPIEAAILKGSGQAVIVFANIHGIEFIGAQVALKVLRDHAPKLAQKGPVVIVPVLNPDGYARTVAQAGQGPLASMRTNARGVDLNRNFPLPSGQKYTKWPGGGKDLEGAATYRGRAGGSELETQVALELGAYYRPVAAVSLHSFMGTMITPRLATRKAFSSYAPLCSAFQSAQQTRYRRLGSRVFDGFTGELEDYFHHTLDCWSLCIEHFPLRQSFAQHLRAPSKFWRFNPRTPDDWCQNDAPAIAAFFEKARALGRPSEQ